MEFDPKDDEPIGRYANQFKRYLGVVVGTKMIIFPMAWEQVDAETKKIVWEDILICIYTKEIFCVLNSCANNTLFLVCLVKETLDIPNDEEFKRRVGCLLYIFVGNSSRKNSAPDMSLEREDKYGETTPCYKSNNISTETCATFVKSRHTLVFLVLF